MSKQILFIALLLLATGIADVSTAQQTDENTNQKQLRWGLQLSESYDGVSQAGNNWFFIDTWRRSVFTIGAFVEYEKAELNLNAGYSFVGGELKYKFYKNWAAIAGGSFGKHEMQLEPESIGNYYYTYYEGDLNVMQYYVGLGYHNTLGKRLKFQANAKFGGIQTNKVIVSDIVNSYQNYNSNKEALKTDSYQLSPSFCYGGNIYLELLPRPWKNRKTPLVPFVDVSVMGNPSSNAKREVTIEEWVPGNVVYHEKVDNLNYDLLSVQVQFGLKWYLKF